MKIAHNPIISLGGLAALAITLGWLFKPLEDGVSLFQAARNQRPAQTYIRINSENAITIKLLSDSPEIRIQAILEIPKNQPHSNPNERFKYALEVQLLDQKKQLLWQGKHWASTKVSAENPNNSKTSNLSKVHLTNTASVSIPIQRLAPKAHWLTVRLASPANRTGLIQCQQRITQTKPALDIWKQLTPNEKSERARFNSLSPDLITQIEREQLAGQTWNSIQPTKEHNPNLQTISVESIQHSRKNIETATTSNHPGSALNSGQQLGFSIEGPGLVRIMATHSPLLNSNTRTRIRIQHAHLNQDPLTEHVSFHVTPGKRSQLLSKKLANGTNEITIQVTSGACSIWVERNTTPSKTTSWQPVQPNIRDKTWMILEGHPTSSKQKSNSFLGFNLPAPTTDCHVEYCIQTRSLIKAQLKPPSKKGSVITVEWIDSKGKRTAKRHLSTLNIPAADTIILSHPNLKPGQQVVRYFRHQGGVQQIRISSPHACLIRVCVRTTHSSKISRIPEHQLLHSRHTTGVSFNSEDWFVIDPIDAGRLHKENFRRTLRQSFSTLPSSKSNPFHASFPQPAAPLAHSGHATIAWPPRKHWDAKESAPQHPGHLWTPEKFVLLESRQSIQALPPTRFWPLTSQPYPINIFQRSGQNPITLFDESTKILTPLAPQYAPNHATSWVGTKSYPRFTNRGSQELLLSSPLFAKSPKAFWNTRDGYRAQKKQPVQFLIFKPDSQPLTLKMVVCAELINGTTSNNNDQGAGAEVIDLDQINSPPATPENTYGGLRYELELEIAPQGYKNRYKPGHWTETLTPLKQNVSLRIAETGLDKPFPDRPVAGELTEANTIITTLENDLPKGLYVVSIRPKDKKALWVSLSTQQKTSIKIPAGRAFSQSLNGPNVIRITEKRNHKQNSKSQLTFQVNTSGGKQKLTQVPIKNDAMSKNVTTQLILPHGLTQWVTKFPSTVKPAINKVANVEFFRSKGSTLKAFYQRSHEDPRASSWIPVGIARKQVCYWNINKTNSEPIRFSVSDLHSQLDRSKLFLLTARLTSASTHSPKIFKNGKLAIQMKDKMGNILLAKEITINAKPDPMAWLPGETSWLSTPHQLHIRISPETQWISISLLSKNTSNLLVKLEELDKQRQPVHSISTKQIVTPSIHKEMQYPTRHKSVLTPIQTNSNQHRPCLVQSTKNPLRTSNVPAQADWGTLRNNSVRLKSIPQWFLIPTLNPFQSGNSWTQQQYARLHPNTHHMISIASKSPAKLLFWFKNLSPQKPLNPISIELDNKRSITIKPTDVKGSFSIKNLLPGKHILRFSCASKDLRLYANAPPADSKSTQTYHLIHCPIISDNPPDLTFSIKSTSHNAIRIPIFLSHQNMADFKFKHFLIKAKLTRQGTPPSAQISEGHTPTVRNYLVNAIDQKSSKKQGRNAMSHYYPGDLWFPIADDIGPGFYRMELEFPKGIIAYGRILIYPNQNVQLPKWPPTSP